MFDTRSLLLFVCNDRILVPKMTIKNYYNQLPSSSFSGLVFGQSGTDVGGVRERCLLRDDTFATLRVAAGANAFLTASTSCHTWQLFLFLLLYKAALGKKRISQRSLLLKPL